MVYFKKLNILILKANSIFTLSSFYLVLWNWRTISISFYFIMLMIKEFIMNIQPFWIRVSWTLLCNNINVQYKMLNFFLILNTISIMFKNRKPTKKKNSPSIIQWLGYYWPFSTCGILLSIGNHIRHCGPGSAIITFRKSFTLTGAFCQKQRERRA